MKTIIAGAVLAAAMSLTAHAEDVATKAVAFKSVEKTDKQAFASNIVGLDVYNNANEDVGEIKDVVIGSDMKVTGLVMSVGGFLGLGAKYIIVDPASVAVSHDDAKKEWTAKVDATKEQLTAAPEFKYEGKFKD